MITRILIALNVIGFLWEISVAGPSMLSFGGSDRIQRVLELGALSPASALQAGQWWRIFTSAFLHGGLAHIAVNMISLWSLGRFIEWALGLRRMLLIYVVSLVAAGLGVVYLSPADHTYVGTVGASGAIFGLFGALFALGLKLGQRGMQLVKDNLGILILNLIITFVVPAIAWQAHVCGLLAGFVLTYAIYYPPKRVQPVVVDARTGAELESEYQTPSNPPNQSAP